MNEKQFLTKYRTSLHDNGLPGTYVNRAVEELRDHLEDLQIHGKDCSQIGELSDLTKAAVAGYRTQTISGRHPILVIFFSGVFLLPVFWMFYFFLAGFFMDFIFLVVAPGIDWGMQPLPVNLRWIVMMFYQGSFIIPFLIVGWLGAKWAIHCGRGMIPVLIVVGVQMFLSLICFSSLDMQDNCDLTLIISAPDDCIVFSSETISASFEQQILQMMMILLAGCFTIWRFSHPIKNGSYEPATVGQAPACQFRASSIL